MAREKIHGLSRMIMSPLAHDLHDWRKRLGITQARAAAIFDVPLRTYQGWEAGRDVWRPRIVRMAMEAVEKNEKNGLDRNAKSFAQARQNNRCGMDDIHPDTLTAKNVIAALQVLVDKYGDLPVTVSTDDENANFGAREIRAYDATGNMASERVEIHIHTWSTDLVRRSMQE
jgi:DNA-binding XRE family transcriptional regulator